MGRFLSLALVLAACGDNLGSDITGPDPTGQDPVGTQTTGGDDSTARFVPAVCSALTWSSNITTTDMDLAVAGRQEGAAVVAVPLDGGAVSGFTLDTRMKMMSGEQKVDVKVAMDQVSVSYLGNRIATTGIAGDAMFLYLLDTDLSNPQFITKMPATTIAKPAFYQDVADDIVMPVGTADGLAYAKFADSGEPLGSTLLVPSKPVRSLTAAQMGVSIFTAWSTDSECYMMQSPTFSAGHTSYQPIACPNPSLAVDPFTQQGVMVFDSAEGARAMFTNGAQFGGDAVLLRPDTTSPRALWDGSKMWISYLDTRGDVIVGYMNADRHLVTMSLGGPKPFTSAYQLALVGGKPWVFAFDDTGYSGYQLCAEAQQ
jgi:hypothetical protein